MLSSNYTKDLLNLQDVNIIKVQHFSTETLIYTQLPVKPHICPGCSHSTSYIHDYRIRKIKDISAFGMHVTLIQICLQTLQQKNFRKFFQLTNLRAIQINGY